MQKDKSQPPSQRTATRGLSNNDTGTLGAKGKKTLAVLRDSRAHINSATSAKKWLIKKELLIEGEDVTTSALAQALLWIQAAGEKNTADQLVDGIRAVALCLEGSGYGEVFDVAVGEIKETAVLWVGEAKEVLQKAVKEAVEEVVEAAKKSMAEGSKKSWADQTDEELLGQGTGFGQSQPFPSFARAAAAGARRTGGDKGLANQANHDYIVGEALKRRRILIDGIEGVKSAAGGLSPKEILEKANIALAAAVNESEDGPRSDPAAISAKVLENGGVVLEFDSEETATWLLDKEIRKVFENNFGGSTKLVDQLFHVVVNFLPVNLRDMLPELVPKIEDSNCI